MSEQLARIGSWVNHLVKARTRHAVHSPFVYELIDRVLRADTELPEFEAVERLRDDLLASEQTIRVNDLGAGSRVLDLPIRSVSDIAATALKSPRHARLLYRLARHFDARSVLELGTSFGISTLYLSLGAENGQVTTIEGCPQTYRIAQHHFAHSRRSNITAVLGSFRSRLPEVLQRIERPDLVFIDGHHARQPTLDYFELCLARAHDATVFVLDDIHWSRGMQEAWEEVKRHPRINVTIDLYDLGLAFLRNGQAEEHFKLRY